MSVDLAFLIGLVVWAIVVTAIVISVIRDIVRFERAWKKEKEDRK